MLVVPAAVWFDHDVRRSARAASAAVTTHDLPTVAGVWSSGDAELREPFVELTGTEATALDVLVAAHRTIAESPARLVLATVDDLAGSVVRPNSPGTRVSTTGATGCRRRRSTWCRASRCGDRRRHGRWETEAADGTVDLNPCPRWDSNPHALADNGF